jgi:DnaJ-class molecular chaperone
MYAENGTSGPDGPVADSDDGYKLSHSDLWETCGFCGGSGEGMHEGQVCVACRGEGEVPRE